MVSVVHLMCYPHFSDLEPSTRCTSSIELQNRLITELALSITYPYHAYDYSCFFFFFFQAEDGIRDIGVTGVQTCALPIFSPRAQPDSLRPRDRQRREAARPLLGQSLLRVPGTGPLRDGRYAPIRRADGPRDRKSVV